MNIGNKHSSFEALNKPLSESIEARCNQKSAKPYIYHMQIGEMRDINCEHFPTNEHKCPCLLILQLIDQARWISSFCHRLNEYSWLRPQQMRLRCTRHTIGRMMCSIYKILSCNRQKYMPSSCHGLFFVSMSIYANITSQFVQLPFLSQNIFLSNTSLHMKCLVLPHYICIHGDASQSAALSQRTPVNFSLNVIHRFCINDATKWFVADNL